MRSVIRAAAVGAALFLLVGSLHAGNGVLIVEKTTGMGPAPTTNQIQIESNRMRAESSGPTGSKRVVVFDGTRQVLMMIDNDRKTYTEVTREEADRLGAQLSDAMARLEQQLANMPPEQRAQVEAMMKGRMGGPGLGAKKTEYRKAGKGEVGKWPCDKYEGYEGDKKTSEICTADPKALGFTMADFAVTQQMMDFFKRLAPQMAGQMFQIGISEQQGYSGIPVRRTFTVDGREVTSEISEVSRQSFPEASYAPPAGYTKESMGLGGRGR